MQASHMHAGNKESLGEGHLVAFKAQPEDLHCPRAGIVEPHHNLYQRRPAVQPHLDLLQEKCITDIVPRVVAESWMYG